MNPKQAINKLLAITLIISLTLGCNILTGLGGTPNPNLPPLTLPEIAASNNPQTLIDHITQAATDDERYIALLEILKSLNLGVYTGKGEAILLGAERGPDDFYLYDFEVSALASALERKETWSVAEIAAQLSDIGVQPGGKPLSPQILQEGLTAAAIKSTQDPGNPLSLVHLLIRELGLRQAPSYDISTAISSSSEQIKFDALQRFLIFSDVLVPLGASSVQSHIFTKSVNYLSNEGFHLSAPGEPCGFTGAEDVNGSKFGILFPAIIAVKFPLDTWHGQLLGLLIDVQETQASIGKNTTHYGPVGAHVGEYGEPGKPMLFQIGVQMLADLSQYPALQCGKLAGLTFPPKGPVPGVNINWNHIYYGTVTSYAILEKHGTIVREDTVTDSNGLASLVFQPKDESDETMFVRQTKEDIYYFQGSLGPSAGIASSFGNVLALGAEFWAPKGVVFGFIIEYHKSTGYQASGQQKEMTYSGVICSLEQPFSVLVTSPVYAFTIEFTPSGLQAGSFTISGTWTDVGPMTGSGSYTVSTVDNVPNQLIANATWSTSTPVQDVSGGGTMIITLTPLDPNECLQP